LHIIGLTIGMIHETMFQTSGYSS